MAAFPGHFLSLGFGYQAAAIFATGCLRKPQAAAQRKGAGPLPLTAHALPIVAEREESDRGRKRSSTSGREPEIPRSGIFLTYGQGNLEPRKDISDNRNVTVASESGPPLNPPQKGPAENGRVGRRRTKFLRSTNPDAATDHSHNESDSPNPNLGNTSSRSSNAVIDVTFDNAIEGDSNEVWGAEQEHEMQGGGRGDGQEMQVRADSDLRQLEAEAAQSSRQFDEEELLRAKRMVADFIRAEEDVEEAIVQAGRQGLLSDAVLLVIRNRLRFARHQDEKEVAQCLDLLYRRIEAEMEAQRASPAMRLLNDLLHLADELSADVSADGESKWRRAATSALQDAFLPEDPFVIAVPSANKLPSDASSAAALLRIDFISEVDALLEEVHADMAATWEALLQHSPDVAEAMLHSAGVAMPGGRQTGGPDRGVIDIDTAVEGGKDALPVVDVVSSRDRGESGRFGAGDERAEGVEAGGEGGSLGLDADMVAVQLRVMERLRVLHRVEMLRDLAARMAL